MGLGSWEGAQLTFVSSPTALPSHDADGTQQESLADGASPGIPEAEPQVC